MAKLTKKDQAQKQKTQNTLQSFQEISSVLSLHKSTLSCLRGKQGKKPVAICMFRLAEFIIEIHVMLNQGKYKSYPTRFFTSTTLNLE